MQYWILFRAEVNPFANGFKMMKIGCSTWCIEAVGFEEKLVLIAETGIRVVELYGRDFPPGLNRKLVQKSFQQRGLEAYSYHSINSDKIRDPEINVNTIATLLRREIEAASSYGAGLIVLHPPPTAEKEKINYMKEVLTKLLPRAHQLKIILGVENLRDSSVEELYALIEYFSDPLIKFVLDIGHACGDGTKGNEILLRWVSQMSEYLVQVHAEDTSPDSWHVPPGRGFTDWRRLHFALTDNDFSGYLIIETSPTPNSAYIQEAKEFLLSLEPSKI